MVRKKMEGDEKQRGRVARRTRRAGGSPSAERVTTGASKQRSHLPSKKSVSHEEKLRSIHKGKQQDMSPEPRPGHRGES